MTRIKVYYTDRPPEDVSFLEVDSLSVTGTGGVQGLSVVNGVLTAQHIILKYATEAEWLDEDPVLLAGEMGIESDTRKFKFGDGSTAWSALAYASGGGGASGVW